MPSRMKAVLIGAGGHARVVLDAARAGKRIDVVAIIDDDPAKHGTPFEGLTIEGDRSILPALRRRGVEAIVFGVGSTVVSAARRSLFEGVRSIGLEVPPVVHPSAVISPTARIGRACVVFAGAVLNPEVELGDNVIVNTAAFLEHDVRIGAHAHVSPGARLAGGVIVGEGAHIGIGATVLRGVHIGRDVMVGAGTVVLRDLADGSRVAGVPAHPI
jgi:sugar O-acyltransferase (sialic acid O-acetyltransferase NeuD family)